MTADDEQALEVAMMSCCCAICQAPHLGCPFDALYFAAAPAVLRTPGWGPSSRLPQLQKVPAMPWSPPSGSLRKQISQ